MPQALSTANRPTRDVCVVGGGLAGLAAAITAARGGSKVTLVEKAVYPRPKVCGGCLNGAAVAVLRELGVAEFLESASSRLTRAYLCNERTSAEVPIPASRGIGRDVLDEVLFRAAVAEGVDVLTGQEARITAAVAGEPHRRVRLSGGGEISAKLVIASSGLARSSHARTREVTNVTRPHSHVGIGLTFDTAGALPESIHPPGLIRMSVTAQGYAGIAPAGGSRVSIAAAVSPKLLRQSGGPREAVESILARTNSRCLAPLPHDGWLATPPLTRRSPLPAAWRLVEVGDASGYVEPFTGEGMAWALLGGREVGRNAARWCDDPKASMLEWPRLLRRRTAARKAVCRSIAWALRRPALTTTALRVLSVVPAFGTAATAGTTACRARQRHPETLAVDASRP